MAANRAALKSIQKLIDERDRLRIELATLTGEIAGLDRAIALMRENGDTSSEEPSRSGRGEAKIVVLDLLDAAGAEGLNALIAEDMAKARGITLNRGTAASNLSRLKKDGAVVHDGERYRLAKFARQSGFAQTPEGYH